MRSGREVDGLVVSTPKGEQVYTITGAEGPYRALIEDMKRRCRHAFRRRHNLFCKHWFCKNLRRPMEKIVGVKIETIVCPTSCTALRELLLLGQNPKECINKGDNPSREKISIVPTLISINSLQSDTLKNLP